MRLLVVALVLTMAVAVTASVFAIWPVVADAPWEDEAVPTATVAPRATERPAPTATEAPSRRPAREPRSRQPRSREPVAAPAEIATPYEPREPREPIWEDWCEEGLRDIARGGFLEDRGRNLARTWC